MLPERIPGGPRGLQAGKLRRYTAHNSGADLYPYLTLTAELTEPEIYRGRMVEMLRSEVRYASQPIDLFGAAEYASDGLLAVTELLGRHRGFTA